MGFFGIFEKKKSDELSEELVNNKTLKSNEVEKDLAEKALKIIAYSGRSQRRILPL